MFITFEHRVTRVSRWKVTDRCHIVYLTCVSNARVLKKSVKINQSEGIPDPGIPERSFVKFAHRRSLASSRHAFYLFIFFFLHALFSALRPDWRTGRLEEAKRPPVTTGIIWLVFNYLKKSHNDNQDVVTVVSLGTLRIYDGKDNA